MYLSTSETLLLKYDIEDHLFFNSCLMWQGLEMMLLGILNLYILPVSSVGLLAETMSLILYTLKYLQLHVKVIASMANKYDLEL